MIKSFKQPYSQWAPASWKKLSAWVLGRNGPASHALRPNGKLCDATARNKHMYPMDDVAVSISLAASCNFDNIFVVQHTHII
jgi:hypothetical protein